MHRLSRSWIKYNVFAVMLGAALAAPAWAAAPDAWITAKVKLALLTTEGVSGTDIKVDTVIGRVTLYGKAYSAEEKAKAETIARRVDGVEAVRNLLVVAPAPEKATRLSDDDLKLRVEQALQADPSLKSSNIGVESANNGVVLLDGTAKTLSAHLRAAEVAAAVPGVRGITSKIQSPQALADAEIWRGPSPHQSKAGYGVWDTASDIWITSDVRMRFLADTHLPALEIDLDTWDGAVTLFGIVPSQDAKAVAEADALKVNGVTRVVNELQVVASANQPSVNARDDELQPRVRRALDEHEFTGVGLEVRDGVARLTGSIPTGARGLEAAVEARSVPGVRAVEDDLRLPAVD
jgi:hyperosmotically inducible periplasmic protein